MKFVSAEQNRLRDERQTEREERRKMKELRIHEEREKHERALTLEELRFKVELEKNSARCKNALLMRLFGSPEVADVLGGGRHHDVPDSV